MGVATLDLNVVRRVLEHVPHAGHPVELVELPGPGRVVAGRLSDSDGELLIGYFYYYHAYNFIARRRLDGSIEVEWEMEPKSINLVKRLKQTFSL